MLNLKLIGAGVLALALVGTHTFAWIEGGSRARAEAIEQDNKEMKRIFAWGVEQQTKAAEAEAALAKLLNAPKAEPEVRTIIRENPSHCVVPEPVDDQLRKSIREANARIRGSLGPH